MYAPGDTALVLLAISYDVIEFHEAGAPFHEAILWVIEGDLHFEGILIGPDDEVRALHV